MIKSIASTTLAGVFSISALALNYDKDLQPLEYVEEYTDPSYVHVYKPLEILEPLDYKILECSENPECSKLAEAIVYEARSETETNQLKVASVILNRADHKNFPDTVIEVIEQPHQFSYLGDMHKQNNPSRTAWNKGYTAAYDVLIRGIRTTEALFYFNPDKVKSLPKWAKVYTRIEIAGNHHFYTY